MGTEGDRGSGKEKERSRGDYLSLFLNLFRYGGFLKHASIDQRKESLLEVK